MIIKINDKLFEITDIYEDKIPDDDYYVQSLLKVASYMINTYKKELNLDIEDIIDIYKNALLNADKMVDINEYNEVKILDLDGE